MSSSLAAIASGAEEAQKERLLAVLDMGNPRDAGIPSGEIPFSTRALPAGCGTAGLGFVTIGGLFLVFALYTKAEYANSRCTGLPL
jgi:hypothetical protein